MSPARIALGVIDHHVLIEPGEGRVGLTIQFPLAYGGVAS